jgi:hypothetical protein
MILKTDPMPASSLATIYYQSNNLSHLLNCLERETSAAEWNASKARAKPCAAMTQRIDFGNINDTL